MYNKKIKRGRKKKLFNDAMYKYDNKILTHLKFIEKLAYKNIATTLNYIYLFIYYIFLFL